MIEIGNWKFEIGKKRKQKSRVFYYGSSNFQFPISNFYDKDFNYIGATYILVFYDSD